MSTNTEDKHKSSAPSNHASEKKEEHTQKSYWYPDRTANIEEVNTGYQDLLRDDRVKYLTLIPVMVSLVYMGLHSEHTSKVFELVKEQLAIEARRSNPSELWLMFGALLGGIVLLIFLIAVYFVKKTRPVYLKQFVTFQPPDNCKVPAELFISKSRECGFFDEDSLTFQEKLLARNGLGDETYFPPGIVLRWPPDRSMAAAREEAELVLFGCCDEIFSSTKLQPKDIDILVVNCSLFNPTPSLSEMIVNKYKMKSSTIIYNLSGMGCSAGVLSIDLAKDLLQVYKNSYALVVSTENITQNWYTGKNKAMLISNTIFRMGGAAILLSNKPADKYTSKYQLEHIVRVHKGANEHSFKSVYQEEDEDKMRGVALSKDLIKVAGDALKSNLTTLGPLVLPWSEQIKFFVNLIQRKVEGLTGKEKKTPSYVPDFKKAFNHFCIHAGGRAIIDGLEENLKLTPKDVEPSRATLYRYGNTSSSSIWYELMYIERAGNIRRGENVLQIALGSGFQCNSCIWRRIK